MNQIIMPNNENDVIRYLTGEMDPTEEVLMEREMMEDDDLLIEVESMRQTMNRLEDLPENEPSEELTNSIIEQAAEHRKRWFNYFPAIPGQVYKYAAVLLVGIGLSTGFWLIQGKQSESNELNSNSPQTASVEVALPASFNTVSAKQSEASANQLKVSTNQTKVEPWVDHNDIIYFQDRFNATNSAFQNIVEASKEKVTPLQGPPSPTFRSQNIHLAGAHHR